MSIDVEHGHAGTGNDTETRRHRARSRWIAVAVAIAVALIAALVVAVRHAGVHTVRLNVSGVANGPGAWSVWPDSPLRPRFQHLMVATDSGLFVWGGVTDFEDTGLSDGAYFDGSTRSWRRLPDSPLVPRTGDAAGVWTGTEVIVVNGREGDVRSAAFDPISFSWRSLPDVPIERVTSGQTQILDLDGTIVVFDSGHGVGDGHVVRLDEAAGAWEQASPSPIGLAHRVHAVSIGDRAVVAVLAVPLRGLDCATFHLLTYRPASDTWAELEDGPVTTRQGAAVAWTGSELFVGVGETCENGHTYEPSNAAQLFDPATGMWRTTSSAPIGFADFRQYAGVWTGNSVMTARGDGALLLYNPVSDTWHVAPAPGSAGQWLDTPAAAFDRWIVISGGTAPSTGSECCVFSDGTYAYQLPDGW